MKETDSLDSIVNTSSGLPFIHAAEMLDMESGEDVEIQHIDFTAYEMRDAYTLLRQYKENQWRMGTDLLAPRIQKLERSLLRSDVNIPVMSLVNAFDAWLERRGLKYDGLPRIDLRRHCTPPEDAHKDRDQSPTHPRA